MTIRRPAPKKKTTTTAAPKRKRSPEKRGDFRAARAARAAGPRTEEERLAAASQTTRVLSGAATRYLRGLGHHLAPIVQIGKEGITDSLVAATREALLAHELIKVRVGTESPVDRKDAGAELADRAGAALAQTLGRTLLLYKRHPQKPKIVLPR
jgi:RNA-binding protein